MKDEEIIRMYLERDEHAISCSAEKYGSRLRALALGITGNTQTAEECENDTYLEAWNLIPPHKPVTYFYAFLARITRHISIDCCRKQLSLKRNAYLVELNEELETHFHFSDNIGDSLFAEELGNAISDYLRTLPQEKRVVFIRRYFYLDSIQEISRKYSISESKVKSSLFRTRHGLQQHLIKEGYSL